MVLLMILKMMMNDDEHTEGGVDMDYDDKR